MRKSTACVFTLMFVLVTSVIAEPRIIFYVVRGVAGSASVTHIYSLDVGAGGEPVDITPPDAQAMSPVWSPDGGLILFTSATDRDGDSNFEVDLYTLNPNGGGLQRITNTPDRIELDASWSPNGRKIAYCVGSPLKERSVWVLDLDSNVERELVPIGGELLIKSTRLAWSPDGQQIAFNAIGPGNVVGLHTVHTDTKQLDLVHRGLFTMSVQSWLPTGEFLVQEGGSLKLGLLSPNGEFEILFPDVQEKLIIGSARATWRRPDLFVFSAYPPNLEAQEQNVYRVKRDGTGLRQLTFGEEQEYEPDLWTDSLDVLPVAKLTTTWGAVKAGIQ